MFSYSLLLCSIVDVYKCEGAVKVLCNMNIINVGRTLILGLPQKKLPSHWIYYASNAYVSSKTYTFALMRASVWSTTEGKAS